MITTTPLACGSTNPQAIKAAAEFPAKLYAVHGDKIKIRDTAVYYGNGTSKGSKGKGLDVLCSVCGHEWSPAANALLNGASCPECFRLNKINLAGKRRSPRATKEEKERAALLRSEGHTYTAIAEMLGRSTKSIRNWLDPEQAEKSRQRSAKWDKENREQKRANNSRYYNEFEHGREAIRKANNKRRSLEWEAIFPVLIDNVWEEVNMMSYLESWEDRNTYVSYDDCLEYAKLQAIAKEMELIHGEEFHVDHLISLSQGGLHQRDNFKIVPASYNLSKGNKRIHEDEALFCKRIFDIK